MAASLIVFHAKAGSQLASSNPVFEPFAGHPRSRG